MAYSEEEKQKALKRIENGDRIKDIAAEMGISIPTLYNWKRAARPKEEIGQDETKSEKKVIQEIDKLKREEKFEEAIQLAEEHPNSAEIQRERLKIAIMQQDYETAKQIGEQFKGDRKIQSHMLKIAIREEDGDTIRDIRDRFKNDEVIQEQVSRARMYMRFNQSSKHSAKKVKNKRKEMAQLDRIRTQLYYDKVDNEVIEGLKTNRQISEFKKVISLLAICEKRKMKNEAKRIVGEYVSRNEKEKGIIRQILERIGTKKSNIFDITKYDDILGWKMDLKLAQQQLTANKGEIPFQNSWPDYTELLKGFTHIYIGEDHGTMSTPAETIRLLQALRKLHPNKRILLASEFSVINKLNEFPLAQANEINFLTNLYPEVNQAADALNIDQLGLDSRYVSWEEDEHGPFLLIQCGKYLIKRYLTRQEEDNIQELIGL